MLNETPHIPKPATKYPELTLQQETWRNEESKNIEMLYSVNMASNVTSIQTEDVLAYWDNWLLSFLAEKNEQPTISLHKLTAEV